MYGHTNMDIDLNDGLLVGQIVTLVLFVASEWLGKSKCKCNGVMELLFAGCGTCTVRVESEQEKEPAQVVGQDVELRSVMIVP